MNDYPVMQAFVSSCTTHAGQDHTADYGTPERPCTPHGWSNQNDQFFRSLDDASVALSRRLHELCPLACWEHRAGPKRCLNL